jgi:hypothetical protein
MGCTDPRFTGGPVNLRSHFFDGLPVYVPYPYPVFVEEQPADVVEPEPPAPTIFEHRPRAATPPPVTVVASKGETQPQASSREQNVPAQPDSEPVPAILIFRDGHQAELLNYAIVGQTLYDLGTPFVARKIPLADLDLEATIKANQDRGVDFSLPASAKTP